MGILFKLWAKSNGVISKELMSSYAMILLMLHFLLKKGYVNLIYNARKRTSDTAKYQFKRQKNNT
jgi:cell division protein FtsL